MNILGDHRRLTAFAGSVTCAAAAHGADLLWENGFPTFASGLTNATEDVFGFRRTVLDDFVVPAGEVWSISQLRHTHRWDTVEPPAGTGMELALRTDADGAPGPLVHAVRVTDYVEHPIICIFFSKPSAESWTTFESITLTAGTYWFEGTVVGPEVNRWLAIDPPRGNEAWVNYEDFGGLRSSTESVGIAVDVSWWLYGERTLIGDADGDGDVDFRDVLTVITAWGACPPADPCRADVDGDGDVDFQDLMLVLANWTGS